MQVEEIIRTIGEPDNERVELVLTRLERVKGSLREENSERWVRDREFETYYNCTSLAQALIGVRTDYLSSEVPISPLWANDSNLVFFGDQGYEVIPSVNEIGKDAKGFVAVGNNPYSQDECDGKINFDGEKIQRISELYEPRTAGRVHTNLLDRLDPEQGWERLKDVVEEESVVSLLMYRSDGRSVKLGEFHHSTIVENRGKHFLVEKWEGSRKEPELYEITSGNLPETFKHFETALRLVAVGSNAYKNRK